MGLKLENLPKHTYADYLQWEGKWELIYGVPYAMSPSPARTHQNINVNLVYYLNHLAGLCAGCEAIMSFDWKISEETVLQPDASVTCGKHNENYLEDAPEIIFEILSPSSLFKDKHTKYDIYEQEGVKYYILINPKNKSAIINVLKEGKYIPEIEILEKGIYNFTLSKCTFDFDFSKIW